MQRRPIEFVDVVTRFHADSEPLLRPECDAAAEVASAGGAAAEQHGVAAGDERDRLAAAVAAIEMVGPVGGESPQAAAKGTEGRHVSALTAYREVTSGEDFEATSHMQDTGVVAAAAVSDQGS